MRIYLMGYPIHRPISGFYRVDIPPAGRVYIQYNTSLTLNGDLL
jgi:hypothetical protein